MMRVRDVMTSKVITVLPDTPLREVARLLAEHRISGLPVVDEAGTVVGVVSEADFLAKEQGADAIHHRPLAWLLGESRLTRAQLARLAARTAGEAMSAPAVTIEHWRRIAEAAQRMVKRGIDRLPVVDDNGSLAGIVSRADLVRAFVRTDAELESVIRREVLDDDLWLDSTEFIVDVTDGVASVAGATARHSTADMIARMVATVPGVLDVRTDVSWWFDDSRIRPSEPSPEFPFGE
jgi:CBS domain-containing protein